MSDTNRSLSVAGLFAGIGGLEIGLERHGHTTEFLCELDPAAREVLHSQFPGAEVHEDIRTLRSLPDVDLVAAGFPCQDLSLAGTQKGLKGERSGLVSELLRLIAQNPPELVLIENVLYLVKRAKGALLRTITDQLEELGYRWAYRVVDTRGFGLPQRRQRVILLASAGEIDPTDILLRRRVQPDIDDRIQDLESGRSYGFYWTEGKRGVGWAPDAVPTIKGGSGLGIPSPPAVFDTGTEVAGTPTIDDGERLQGFDPGWTDVKLDGERLKAGTRWSLIGNAVSVPVSDWLGSELAGTVMNDAPIAPVIDFRPGRPMPLAASNTGDGFQAHEPSLHVSVSRPDPIAGFLADDPVPLSTKALDGFLRRAEAGNVNLPSPFLNALAVQADSQRS